MLMHWCYTSLLQNHRYKIDDLYNVFVSIIQLIFIMLTFINDISVRFYESASVL